MRTGTRAQVYHGTATRTSGGLTKSDLMMNKNGRIVSRKKHNSAKKEMRLLKHGYGTKKGKFGFVKIGSKRHHSRSKSRKMRGGNISGQLNPADAAWEGYGISGAGVTSFSPSSVGLQIEAGMSGGRRRRRHHMRGGSGMKPMSPAAEAAWDGNGISGAGVTNFSPSSVGLQIEAGMSGGRRRRHSRRMRGGTTEPVPGPQLWPNAV